MAANDRPSAEFAMCAISRGKLLVCSYRNTGRVTVCEVRARLPR